MLAKFLEAKYRDGARGEGGYYDCWGLARAARVALYGRPLLESRGGEYQHDPAGFTARYREQIAEMVEVPEPVVGAVIAVLKRRVVCTHVALVVHDINRTGLGLHALEINPGQNARIVPLYRFRETYPLRVIKFYDDKSIPEPA